MSLDTTKISEVNQSKLVKLLCDSINEDLITRIWKRNSNGVEIPKTGQGGNLSKENIINRIIIARSELNRLRVMIENEGISFA